MREGKRERLNWSLTIGSPVGVLASGAGVLMCVWLNVTSGPLVRVLVCVTGVFMVCASCVELVCVLECAVVFVVALHDDNNIVNRRQLAC